MENQQSKKSYSFKLVNTSRRRQSSIIENQTTLLGAYFDLRMGQKVIGALVSLIDTFGVAKTISICFKIEADKIPDEVKSLSTRKMNLLQLKVAECDPIPIMVIVIADDSSDLLSSYKVFLSNSEKLNLINFDSKMNYILSDYIQLERKAGEISLRSTPLEDYQKMQKKIQALNKRIKSTPISSASSSSTPNAPIASTSRASSVVEVSQDSQQPPAKKMRYILEPADFKKLEAEYKNIIYESVRPWAAAVMDVLRKFTAPVEIRPKTSIELRPTTTIEKVDVNPESIRDENIRKIPEVDATYEKNGTMFIEGTLPVPARSYRLAMRSQPQKVAIGNEPSFWLSNIVRDCFPEHWLIGTTIRGQGGKASLVSIWNYHIPETDPSGGFFEDGLGERRLRALLDHVVRKTKKDSYDKTVEKHLLDSLAKYLHYARVRVEQKPKRKRKKPRIESSEESDINPTDFLQEDMETDSEQPRINRSSSPRSNLEPSILEGDIDDEEEEEEEEGEFQTPEPNHGNRIPSIDLVGDGNGSSESDGDAESSQDGGKHKEPNPSSTLLDLSSTQTISFAQPETHLQTGITNEGQVSTENTQSGEKDLLESETISKPVEKEDERFNTETDDTSSNQQDDSGIVSSPASKKDSTDDSKRKLEFNDSETSGQDSEQQQGQEQGQEQQPQPQQQQQKQQQEENSSTLDQNTLATIAALVEKNPKNRELLAQLFGEK
uniref:Uncharacterized protein n=1 Tax=Tetranychus urticae TaxID=32264 RepID=T1KZ95_TETUR